MDHLVRPRTEVPGEERRRWIYRALAEPFKTPDLPEEDRSRSVSWRDGSFVWDMVDAPGGEGDLVLIERFYGSKGKLQRVTLVTEDDGSYRMAPDVYRVITMVHPASADPTDISQRFFHGRPILYQARRRWT